MVAFVAHQEKALHDDITGLQSPERAGLSWGIWFFSANRKGQDRGSTSLMNCMLKEIHILPVVWLCAGTCFFNRDWKKPFWQDQILLRAIYLCAAPTEVSWPDSSLVWKDTSLLGHDGAKFDTEVRQKKNTPLPPVQVVGGALWECGYRMLLLPCACFAGRC